jgi:hypothetical protein
MEAPIICPKFKRLPVDLRSLITAIEGSPWASDETFAEVSNLAKKQELTVPIQWSDLADISTLIGTEKDLQELLRGRDAR